MVGSPERIGRRTDILRLWHQTRTLSSSRPVSRHIVGVTILLLVLLHLANGLLVLHFYVTNANREHEARDARATLLAEHASRAFSAIDLSLLSIIEKLPADVAEKPVSVFTQMLLDERIRGLPQIRHFLILDESGMVVYDSRQFPATPRYRGRSPYFAEQKKWRGVGLFIGEQAYSSVLKRAFFGVSRPLLDDNGNFHGIVVALADSAYFSTFYGTQDVAASETAILAREDGAILAGSMLAGDREHLPSLAEVIATRPHSTTITREVPSFPLQIVLTGASPAASAGFRSFVIADGGVMALVTVVALGLAGILAAEARAREKAESRLHDAIESTPAGFALFDKDDRLILSNEPYRVLWPVPLRDLITPGTRFDELAAAAAALPEPTPESERNRRRYFIRRMKSHRAGNGEILQRTPSGRWLLIRERRTNEGGTVAFHTDITDFKKQEQALRRSEQAERLARERAERADHAKSAFLATMSHELRTPLNAVIGFSEIIEQELFGSIPERYREYASLIRNSGLHLLAIINDILDIAKLQSGKTELHLAPASVPELIADSLRILMQQAEAAGTALVSEVSAALPLIEADATRLRQILLNLLSNAIKFTPTGGRITLRAYPIEDGIRIDVIDNGIGMEAADIPTALQPFGQISNAITRSHEGTGLGLPLSKSLVELHGGRLEIASAPGLGTTVSVILPVPLAEAEPQMRPRSAV